MGCSSKLLGVGFPGEYVSSSRFLSFHINTTGTNIKIAKILTMAKLAILLFLSLFSFNFCHEYPNDDTEIDSEVMSDLMADVDSMARDSETMGEDVPNQQDKKRVSEAETLPDESGAETVQYSPVLTKRVRSQSITLDDSDLHFQTKSTTGEEVSQRDDREVHKRRKAKEYVSGVEEHKKLDEGSQNHHQDKNGSGQLTHVNQDHQQINGNKNDVPQPIKVQQELAVKSNDQHVHHQPELCSEVMDKVLRIAEPMKDEIIKNVGEARLGFGYFAKKVKDAALKGGIISGQNGQPCIPSFKIDMNRLFTYWAENFQGYRAARNRSFRKKSTNDIRTTNFRE